MDEPVGSGGATDARDVADGPSVSVVLPARDSAAVLPGAVATAFDQTHRPLELIVVDGGSTDGTDDVLDAVDDDRLRVVRHAEPRGPSAARNAGVRAADGEYVAFVDADDRWRPAKLERQLAAMDRRGAPVALSGLEKPVGEPRTRDGTGGDVHGAVRRLDLPTYTSTLVASRAALVDVGGFDESLGCFEDWELCLRLAREYPFAFVSDPLVLKGARADNVSAEPDRLAAAFERLDCRYDLPRCARARFLADVGVTHFEAGRFAAGRPYVVRSLELDPARPKLAVALALTYAGRAAFDAWMPRVYGAERLLRAGVATVRRQMQATDRA